MRSLPEDHQLALIRAHPDLGSRATMANASVAEQAGAGLDRLSPANYKRLDALNQSYRDRFGFPFILAVKDATQADIFAAIERRLNNDEKTERETALQQIERIAWWRLQAWVVDQLAERSPRDDGQSAG